MGVEKDVHDPSPVLPVRTQPLKTPIYVNNVTVIWYTTALHVSWVPGSRGRVFTHILIVVGVVYCLCHFSSSAIVKGGVTLDAQQIKTEAQEEIIRLEEESRLNFEMPVMDLMG